MDFIQENYVWLIVGGIVILMAIIGYFADKTDFGRRELRKKREKEFVPTPEVKEESKLEVEEKEEIALKTKEKKKKKEKTEKKNKSKEKKLEEVVETEEKNDNVVNIDEMFNDPIVANDNQLEDNSNIDESLFAPLTENLPELDANETVDSLNEVAIEPLVDVNEGVEPVAEEDDIWKF